MMNRARRVGGVLAVAAAAALLLSALPGSVATAASPTACKVRNLDSGVGRDSLQRAVWAASPGDHLAVRGTCTGTTLIRKDLHIEGRSGSRRAIVRSGSSYPTIVVDPRVDDLVIDDSLSVRGGIIITSVRAWKQSPTKVTSFPRPPKSDLKFRIVSTCRVGGGHPSFRSAIAAADPGDRLPFSGTCVGRVRIDRDLRIVGARMGASSMTCDKDGKCRTFSTETGPPRIKSFSRYPTIVVDPSVEHLRLSGFGIRDGFRIGPLSD